MQVFINIILILLLIAIAYFIYRKGLKSFKEGNRIIGITIICFAPQIIIYAIIVLISSIA